VITWSSNSVRGHQIFETILHCHLQRCNAITYREIKKSIFSNIDVHIISACKLEDLREASDPAAAITELILAL
jgi:hypothetical protein